MRHKVLWLIGGFVMVMLLAFTANPSPHPQRVADLIARLEVVEEENENQQQLLDELSERVEALEALGAGSELFLSDDVTIPDEWEQNETSDGILSYWFDPKWELSSDEPGTMDHWLDEDTALFFTWDWADDLLDDLHKDEDFLRFFEEDLIWSDESLQMDLEKSGPVEFMGEDALYWDIRVESAEGYMSRMLTIFYPCSDRVSCNVTLVRFDPDPEDDEGLAEFTTGEWSFLHTFANGVEFLTIGKATVSANANLRECPAIQCEIVRRLVRGEIVELDAVSEDGVWYRLESGEWISAALVDGAPSDLPVVSNSDDI